MLESTADFSNCGQYRYSLTRIWDRERCLVLFVGLNPSTADGERDDPTVRRCVGYARLWGYGGVVVVNLFAYRSPYPAELFAAPDPIGPRNDAAIAHSQKRAALVVAAWGNHGRQLGRDLEVLAILKEPHCLRLNRTGSPAHPLYLPGELEALRMGEWMIPPFAHSPIRFPLPFP